MRSISLPAVLLAALLSDGCLVLALQPAYDAESIVFEERFLGSWENPTDGTRAAIERGEWRSYKISYSDRSATRTFQGNLTRIGDTTFLDVTEMRGSDPGPFLVPLHGVMKVTIGADAAELSLLNYMWFERALEQKDAAGIALALDDRRNIVITAPTRDVRRWLLRPPDGAFSPPMRFRRVR